MNGKRIDLPWEVCRRVIVKEQKSAEAIVGRKRAIPRGKGQGWKSHGQAEGPNVRMAKELGSL